MGILCIVDGMTDGSAFEASRVMPTFSRMREEGGGGVFLTTPPGYQPDSFTCITTLLGVAPQAIPSSGRAWLEALGAGLDPQLGDLVLRGSLVSLDEEGCLSRLGGVDCPPQRQGEMARRFGLHPLGGYKNLLVLPGEGKREKEFSSIPPHQAIGRKLEDILPQEAHLRQIILESRELLEGKGALFPWGASSLTRLPPLRMRGGAVCRTEIVAGIAKEMGMTVRVPPGATAEVDTDLSSKAAAALDFHQCLPLVLLHINGADEAGHRRNLREKEKFLSQVDRLVLEPLAQTGIPLLVTGDHATSCATGGHLAVPQPFVLWNGAFRGNLGEQPGNQAVSLLIKEGKD